jgi:hypothetical protein
MAFIVSLLFAVVMSLSAKGWMTSATLKKETCYHLGTTHRTIKDRSSELEKLFLFGVFRLKERTMFVFYQQRPCAKDPLTPLVRLPHY